MKFSVRNYKHEMKLDPASPRYVGKYTDAVWETLCQHVVDHGFNGLVLYPSTYHPFEFILDYTNFPEAASRKAADCRATREVLKRGLAIAHRYGLRTFMQHYVSHIPKTFSAHLKLGATAGDRTANLAHPEIDRYMRWVYRETFAQLPDLDGLYFNFESSQDFRHIENTVVCEWNRMKRKPVAVWRVWGINQPEEFCRVVKSYRGQSILCHKGSDTNDTYYLLVTVPGVFDEVECALARLNYLHLLAAADFFAGRSRPQPARAAALAKRNDVPLAAGKELLTAIEASSQLVLLAFRQFCYGSAPDGVVNPGWYSHIQEPFYLWPANGLNGQSSRLPWQPFANMPWINKRLPADVCPENEFQYIIDEANPERPAANWSPRRIAGALDRYARLADSAAKKYEKLVGRKHAAIFRRYLDYNAMAADYFRYEILAGRELFAGAGTAFAAQRGCT